MSSASQPQRLFQLRLDPLTGASEWVVVDEEGDEDPPPLSSTSYLDMLNDSRRNAAFRSAIEKTVTRPCHVLDIGAGTGLLSMLAARAMDSCGAAERAGSEGMVSACESYLPMVKLMRKVLRANGMEKKIRIFPRRSDELKVNSDLPSRADILVSEILDSELLGEGLIPTLRHAHDELLAANPGAVPYRATTYGQLYDLHGSEVHASDGIRLTPVGLETIIRVKRQQYAMHCNALSPEIRLLSEPFKIFEFNFCKRPDDHGEVELHIKATDSGTVHAIISWWVLQLDNEGTIFYSTAPQWISLPVNSLEEVTFVTDWCDHWKQCVWFTPGRGLTVSKDDRVFFEAFHSDTSISYSLRHSSLGIQIEDGGLAIGDSSLTLLPERVAIYGDKEWRLAMVTATKNALLGLLGMVSPLCVIADDSVFLTILTASLSKSSYVISLFPGLCEKGFLYLQAVAKENGFSMDRVKVVGRRKQFLAIEDTNERKVCRFEYAVVKARVIFYSRAE
ncbi:Protein arginine N-methyltransferase 7 [Asimina triloba]